MGSRRRARRLALQALFEADMVAHDPGETIGRLVEEAALPEEGALFAAELVHGVVKNRESIDQVIARHAPAWPVAQLPAVDRNILRLAIFEVLLNNRVPVKAAINEAVELAKTFGSEGSPRFVNGVLGSLERRGE
ncbi:MAG: transcription antitermination factor NusB [Chloroflexota bacterium]|nr:transcription antitermination factor NusB [Chloroflexota bacterium]